MFLSIITRCCRRPDLLKQNIQSVENQTSDKWEQLFLVDPTGNHKEDPILWANKQFLKAAPFIKGDYVYPLDDDGVMVDQQVFEKVLDACHDAPDVVLVKIVTPYYDGELRQWPQPELWDLDWENGARPDKWAGNGYNVYTKADIWRKHLSHYHHHAGGDWHYITSLIKADLYIKRVDIISARSTMRGHGVIFEKCGTDWFEPFEKEYGLKKVRRNIWRLNHSE